MQECKRLKNILVKDVMRTDSKRTKEITDESQDRPGPEGRHSARNLNVQRLGNQYKNGGIKYEESKISKYLLVNLQTNKTK